MQRTAIVGLLGQIKKRWVRRIIAVAERWVEPRHMADGDRRRRRHRRALPLQHVGITAIHGRHFLKKEFARFHPDVEQRERPVAAIRMLNAAGAAGINADFNTVFLAHRTSAAA